ncbi:unnamed protein product, partial [marine sediment metagenome]
GRSTLTANLGLAIAKMGKTTVVLDASLTTPNLGAMFKLEKVPYTLNDVLVRKIAENFRLPYYTITPTFSICMEHEYLRGAHFNCPLCGKPAEVYSRIVGYFRPVQNWHVGKQEEFYDRIEYDEKVSMKEI